MSSMRAADPASYIPSVSLAEYDYDLPESRIAPHPLAERDRSRLLLCDIPSGSIEHHRFSDIVSIIPPDAMLLVNDTRVVRARIIMHKATGGRVEIFLLDPLEPSHDPAIALASHGEGVWCCMIGGAKKIVAGGELKGTFRHDRSAGTITASIEGKAADGYLVRFRWTPESLSFAEVLEAVGRVPLPPYIRREATEEDAESYQTVYAEQEGAVAAPTAGLHFTPRLLDALRGRGVRFERLTLHVGAGTFKQVKGDDLAGHEMHQERIVVSAGTLGALIGHAERRRLSSGCPIVIVGTTTLRTVESLYWFGAKLLAGECADADELVVEQWDPYRLAAEHPVLPDLIDALVAVDRWRLQHGLDDVVGRTRILILPGYQFRCCDALLTNFHQPGSTLILLVGALLGRELWRRVYDAAMEGGYRFLSYGDSSLLIRERFGQREE
jgi:S-adenosylmethionine:tRNA ribosyltransferase-isomerase